MSVLDVVTSDDHFMGDSMKQARAFMRNCQTALFDMAASNVSMSGLDQNNSAGLNTDVCVAALTSVQSGAKLNHALAIYRAAQQALTAIQSPNLLSERIERLSYLISQYETGLLELEAELAMEPKEQRLDSTTDNRDAPHPLHSASLESANDKVSHGTSEARHAQATRALNDTIKLARTSERPALEALLSSAQISDLQNDEKLTAHSQANELITANSAVAKVTLESLVQEIVQLGLTVARQHGLTLSLSYDMDNKMIAEDKAERFKMRSCQWITYLIRHIAASQTVDALAEGMAHIDITAAEKELSFSTIAPDLPVSFCRSAQGAASINAVYEARTNRLTLNMAYQEASSKQNKAAQNDDLEITPKMPVDEGISARLEALLAGNTQLIAFEPKRARS